MLCLKCGAEVIEDAEFCQKCGAKLVADSQPAFSAGSAQQQGNVQGNLPKKKGSKKLPVILGAVILLIVIIIVAAGIGLGGERDNIATVKAHKPFDVSQNLPYTYEEVFGKYLNSPLWHVVSEDKDTDTAVVQVDGTVKGTDYRLVVDIEVSPNPDDPDLCFIRMKSVTMDGEKSSSEDDAAEFLVYMFKAYEEGHEDLSEILSDPGESEQEVAGLDSQGEPGFLSDIITIDETQSYNNDIYGNIELTLNYVAFTDKCENDILGDYIYPDGGNVFLWADVTVKNIGTESGLLGSGEIIYDGQYKYQQSFTVGDSMISMKPLSAPAEGALIFEVPSVVMESDKSLVLNISDGTDESKISYTIRDSGSEDADMENEEQPEVEGGQEMTFGDGISFPILQQGYQDGGEPCPIMTQENVSGVEKYGTYEDMKACLINDGTTMYPAPRMEKKAIYVPIKWDAPISLWYDGLLTYDQFLNAVEIMGRACEENGMEDFYSSGSWEELSVLSGKWSNGADEISISIYSDSDYYNMWDEVGTISSGEKSGTLHLFGVGNDGLYILWSMGGSDEAMFRYLDNGKLELWSITDESLMKKGAQFECVERFES